jgi:hypothetical protein
MDGTESEKSLRGQSAMEFLLTYGWAVLILMIVTAALLFLGVLNPGTTAPNQCAFASVFTCKGYKISDGGSLELTLGQATGDDVTVTGFACTAAENATAAPITPERIPTGSFAPLQGLPRCTNADGSYPAAGEYFTGTMAVAYRDEQTGMDKVVKGTVAYRVEQAYATATPG